MKNKSSKKVKTYEEEDEKVGESQLSGKSIKGTNKDELIIDKDKEGDRDNIIDVKTSKKHLNKVKNDPSVKKFRQLNENNKKKELIQKNTQEVGTQEISCFYLLFRKIICCKKEKVEIIEKCLEILKTYIQVDSIIKSQMDLIFLRRLILTESQNMLFKFLFMNIEMDKPIKTHAFLKGVQEKHPEIDFELFKSLSRDNRIDKILLDKFDEYMNRSLIE